MKNLDSQGEPGIATYWKHKKGGVYFVLTCAYLEKTMERYVVYRASGGSDTWLRPMGEFLDGRFTPLEPGEKW